MADSNQTQTGLDAAAQSGGLVTDVGLVRMVSYGINTLLGLLGIVFFVLVLVGGFQWMTSGGDESKITEAKKRLASATIGLAIVLASLTITIFVTGLLDNGTGGGWQRPPQGGELGDYPLPPT